MTLNVCLFSLLFHHYFHVVRTFLIGGFLADFYKARLFDDASLLRVALKGIHRLVSRNLIQLIKSFFVPQNPKLDGRAAVEICKAVFQEVSVQSLPQQDRFQFFELLTELIRHHLNGMIITLTI